MAEIGALYASLGLDSAQFETGLKRAQGELRNFDRAAKNSTSGLAGLSSQFMVVARSIQLAFAGIVGSAVAQFTIRSIEAAASIGRLAEQAGLTVRQFQELQFAFRDTNVNQEQLAQASATLGRNLSDLQRNTGPFLDFLRGAAPQLVEQFRGVTDVNEAWRILSDTIQGLPNRYDQIRVATAAAGEAGARLISQLSQGGKALDDAAKKADEFGQVLSDRAVRQARELETRMRELSNVLSNAFATAATRAAEALGLLGESLSSKQARLEALNRQIEQATALANRFGEGTEEWARRQGPLNNLLSQHRQLMSEIIAIWERGTTVNREAPGSGLLDESRFAQMRFQADLFVQLAGGARTFEQSLYALQGAETGLTSTVLGSLEGMNFAWMTHAEIVTNAQNLIRQSFKDTEEAQRAMARITQQLNLQYEQQVGQTAQKVGQALVAVFPKSKAAAIAQATINTAVGVSEALKLPFPLNWIQAAAVFAAGIAQVRAIRSTNVGGSSSPPAPGGGAAGGGVQAGQGQMPTQIVIGQLDPRAILSGEQVNQLIDVINEKARSGTIVLASHNANNGNPLW